MALNLIHDGASKGAAEISTGLRLVVPNYKGRINQPLVHGIDGSLFFVNVLKIGIALADEVFRAVRNIRPFDESLDDSLAVVFVLSCIAPMLFHSSSDVLESNRDFVDGQAHGRHASIVFKKIFVIHGLFADKIVSKKFGVLPYDGFRILKHVLAHVLENFNVPSWVLVRQYGIRNRDQNVVTNSDCINSGTFLPVILVNDCTIFFNVLLGGQYEETFSVLLF
mmetsp:Transcript_30762/g.72577  ORF Transcript_30762/g.72577 Transcript_30762/m.72577 type:complete len:223 (-) Transcript_30762:937-1605(-)